MQHNAVANCKQLKAEHLLTIKNQITIFENINTL